MKGQQVDSCVFVLVKSQLSVTVDWRAGGVGQRSTRGAKAPGGAHEPAGACSPQTPPDHWGDPQGSTIGARQVFGVVARGFFEGITLCSSPFLAEGQREHGHRDREHADRGERWQHHPVSVGEPQEEPQVCSQRRNANKLLLQSIVKQQNTSNLLIFF